MSSQFHKMLSLILIVVLLVTYTLSDFSAVYAQQWSEEMPVLGVVDLSAGSGVSGPEALILSDRLRVELANIGAFMIIERSKMEAILDEQNFQLTGCIEEACAVEIGRLLGARKVLIGSVGKVGDTFTVSLRMVNVETGVVSQTAHKDYKGKIDGLLTTVVPNLAKTLSGVEVKPQRGRRWLWITLGVLGAGVAAAAVLAGGEKEPEAPAALPTPPDRP